ncbi:hypothetical protein BHL83_07470 [Limosilactobacillus reuteri]|uniref:Uncharacterized protein n=1 Tax=Limosilactobacillus reuteri TaxID=1598 RepID=A0A1Y2UR78_LIMRT|nr:hypothetical protein [Limosilactobacillus reuteri]MCC4349345.1 hypothetical protein [Limosilactobacillus reuteri]MCC4359736.1 hypothetical protein [Limosilactobacillus reuteri]MCC4379647.1 hypothetical protein [Limosilactobacillus reuteri]MCC4407372.1 hypothetical protein [Limosilactobacillus reuteri]MCC4416693.1 hypothetical protein [Limosilactobacillus reuteri]
MLFKSQNISPIDSFLSSLTYWQKLNLQTVLILGQRNITLENARNQALTNDDDDFRFLLEQALNSPDPKM